MNLSAFRVLTFDCYGTLIDWETGIHEALLPWLERHDRSVPRDEMLAAFGRHESPIQTAHPEMLYPEILVRVHAALAEEWGVPPSSEDAAAFGASVGDWPAFPDSAEALQYLKEHCALVILSNVDRESFARSNAKLGVSFDAVYTAQDIGSYKPDPANFRYLVEHLGDLGFGKEQVLHTAESLYHDHAPAAALGLATAWIHRRHDQRGSGATASADVAVKPDFYAISMADFVAQHRAIRAK